MSEKPANSKTTVLAHRPGIFERAKAAFRRRNQNKILSAPRLPGGYRRIYQFHIRKTGGTSIVKMFHALGGEPIGEVYERLIETNPRSVSSGRYVFSGWQLPLIEQGDYFHAFSHIPHHRIELPKRTWTFTCFRDPVDRVVSHYRMLLDMQAAGGLHPCFKIEGQWLGNSFEEFLERIPREHLLNQVYMFSESFEIKEAIKHVRKLNHWMFLDRFQEGITRLNDLTGLALKTDHQRKSSNRFEPDEKTKAQLQKLVEPEYEMLAQLGARC